MHYYSIWEGILSTVRTLVTSIATWFGSHSAISELIGAKAASTIVALCALLLTIYNAYVARREARLRARPHISAFTSRELQSRGDARPESPSASPGLDTDLTASLVVDFRNDGLGPAWIGRYSVWFDGKPIVTGDRDRMSDAMKPLTPEVPPFVRRVLRHLQRGFVIKQDETLNFLDLKVPIREPLKESSQLDEADKLAELFKAEIDYESIYREKFSFKFPEETTTKYRLFGRRSARVW